jgi:protein-serine/threonine kinase
MLGKGDVGRVYLVREKKTDKLFAMKGKEMVIFQNTPPLHRGARDAYLTLIRSAIKKRNDRTEKDQTGIN